MQLFLLNIVLTLKSPNKQNAHDKELVSYPSNLKHSRQILFDYSVLIHDYLQLYLHVIHNTYFSYINHKLLPQNW